METMTRFIAWALVPLLLFSFGCSSRQSQPKVKTSNRQRMVQRFIDNCDKASPSWTEKQKADYRKKAKAKAVLVTKAIRANTKLKGAKLRVTDWPEAINAGCVDALAVSIDGVVAKPEQKRILYEICIKYSDEIIVSTGAIGTGLGGTG